MARLTLRQRKRLRRAARVGGFRLGEGRRPFDYRRELVYGIPRLFLFNLGAV